MHRDATAFWLTIKQVSQCAQAADGNQRLVTIHQRGAVMLVQHPMGQPARGVIGQRNDGISRHLATATVGHRDFLAIQRVIAVVNFLKRRNVSSVRPVRIGLARCI